MLSFYGLGALISTLESINPTQFGLAVLTACPVKMRKRNNPLAKCDVRLVKVDTGWDFGQYTSRVQGSSASLSGCTDLEYNAKPTWHIPADENHLRMIHKNRNKDDGKRYLAMCSRVDRKGVLDGSFVVVDGKLATTEQLATIRSFEQVYEHKVSNNQVEQGIDPKFGTLEKVVDVENIIGVFTDYASAESALAQIRTAAQAQ